METDKTITEKDCNLTDCCEQDDGVECKCDCHVDYNAKETKNWVNAVESICWASFFGVAIFCITRCIGQVFTK